MMTNYSEATFLEALAVADELGHESLELEGLDFCDLYRGKLRSILGLAIAILSFLRPSLATGLKLIRDKLDLICPV